MAGIPGFHSIGLRSVSLLLLLFAAACGDDNSAAPPEGQPQGGGGGAGKAGSLPSPESRADEGYFESLAANGNGNGAQLEGSGGLSSAGPSRGSGTPAPTAVDGSGGSDAARAIAEADIIQLDGTRLYAMSRSGGLSVIDVSDPAALTILGRYRTSFTPFEMYIRDGIVFAMYSDWGEFVQDEKDEWVWKQTSALLALDVSDPGAIQPIGHFELPGQISDSRLVGDVLYAVSYQNGSCWNCAQKPTTSVVSINVADPNAPEKVDELAFEDQGSQYGWGPRSITVTTERIYVAGPEYGRNQPENSTIQVVDISDPAGDLVEGTTVLVKGQITSRWQMDEYAGTLRVISQPWTWWNNTVPPSLETFTVQSSQSIEKLGQLSIKLPRPESLQSVRFDGDRGYAVTFQRTDPLFSFDLSNPAAPKQMGELEMPGFLYHMEPRGDRLIGLGYDQGNADGAITVSIFDVSDLATPSMLKRVNFGGSWAQLPEDQDRIHKAFKLDPENALMLVPFSGWQPVDKESWCGRSLNGVQLIDWSGDELALRGMTQSLGQARRAFIASDTLFTVAEQEVAAYDITNRDEPAQLSAAPLALNVSMTLPSGEQLVRMRQDWYSADLRLEIVPRSTPDALVAPLTFNVTEYLRKEHGLAQCSYWYPANDPLFAIGDTVWMLISNYGDWREADGSSTKGRSLLIGFSVKSGEVVGSLELPFQSGYWGSSDTARIVRGNVVYLMKEGWDSIDQYQRSLITLNLEDPSQPVVATTLPLPSTNYYSTGLLESGDQLATGYAKPVPGKNEVVRQFALRIDLSEPLAPRVIGEYNTPGYLVDFDAQSASFVTLDQQPTQFAAKDQEDCAVKLPTGWFDEQVRLCRGNTATLHRVRVANNAVKIVNSLRKDEIAWATPRRGEGRLFFTHGYGYRYGGGVATSGPAIDGFYRGWAWSSQQIVVVDSNTLDHSAVTTPGVWNVVPQGQSLVLAPSAGQPLTVIDATNAAAPVLSTTEDTALGYTQHLAVDGQDVFLSQGDGGVQHMTLP